MSPVEKFTVCKVGMFLNYDEECDDMEFWTKVRDMDSDVYLDVEKILFKKERDGIYVNLNFFFEHCYGIDFTVVFNKATRWNDAYVACEELKYEAFENLKEYLK